MSDKTIQIEFEELMAAAGALVLRMANSGEEEMLKKLSIGLSGCEAAAQCAVASISMGMDPSAFKSIISRLDLCTSQGLSSTSIGKMLEPKDGQFS